MYVHLISTATDGASVLTGKTTGASLRLKRDFPNIQSNHCLAHRLELAVHDSLKRLLDVTTLSFSSPGCTTSPPRMQDILRIRQIFTIRCVANSLNAIQAVWKNYPALVRHFKTASEDTSHSDTERKKYLVLH